MTTFAVDKTGENNSNNLNWEMVEERDLTETRKGAESGGALDLVHDSDGESSASSVDSLRFPGGEYRWDTDRNSRNKRVPCEHLDEDDDNDSMGGVVGRERHFHHRDLTELERQERRELHEEINRRVANGSMTDRRVSRVYRPDPIRQRQREARREEERQRKLRMREDGTWAEQAERRAERRLDKRIERNMRAWVSSTWRAPTRTYVTDENRHRGNSRIMTAEERARNNRDGLGNVQFMFPEEYYKFREQYHRNLSEHPRDLSLIHI
jgi:hypothetical protein